MRLASTEGKAFDVYGDVAQNDGRQGHAHRHSTLLQEVVRIARSVWGARVQLEPDDYLPYSTYRPDMAVPYAGDSGSTYCILVSSNSSTRSHPTRPTSNGGVRT